MLRRRFISFMAAILPMALVRKSKSAALPSDVSSASDVRTVRFIVAVGTGDSRVTLCRERVVDAIPSVGGQYVEFSLEGEIGGFSYWEDASVIAVRLKNVKFTLKADTDQDRVQLLKRSGWVECREDGTPNGLHGECSGIDS